VRKLNPKIVYAQASSWGPRGPWVSRPSRDTLAQTASGLMSKTGRPSDPPLAAGAAIADQTGALTLAGGVMAALFARERTGQSQKVDASIYGTMIAAQGFELNYASMTGEEPARAGRGHPFLHGVWGAFRTMFLESYKWPPIGARDLGRLLLCGRDIASSTTDMCEGLDPMPGTGLARDYRPFQKFLWNFVLPAFRFIPGEQHEQNQALILPGWCWIRNWKASRASTSLAAVGFRLRRSHSTSARRPNCGNQVWLWSAASRKKRSCEWSIKQLIPPHEYGGWLLLSPMMHDGAYLYRDDHRVTTVSSLPRPASNGSASDR
jgi:hypothetical protein